MHKTIAALLLYLGLVSAALAQQFTMPPPAGVSVLGVPIVASCGTPPVTYTAGKIGYLMMDTTGKLCDGGGGGGGGGSVTQGTVPWVTQAQPNLTPTDCSGTITSGGTQQSAIAATATLHGFTISNIDTGHNDELLWISFTGSASAGAAGSYPLPAPTATTYVGTGSYTTPSGFASGHALSVIGATTGHIYSCTWW